MKLHVGFDDELMLRYHRRGTSPLCTIYWTLGQEAYPQESWVDFGTVVLSWWLVASCSLLAGSREETLSFMDGPYELSIQSAKDDFFVSVPDSTEEWKVSRMAFFNELLSAANQTVAKLNELQIPDKEGLQIGIRELKAALAEQEAQVQTAPTVKQYAHR